MSTPITIPSLGESINEVVLGQWLVEESQWVKRDAPLVEIESDKVTQELPAPISGILTISKKSGEECSVGDTIGAIDENAQIPTDAQDSTEAIEEVTTETIASAEQTKKVTPLAQKVATDLGVSLENIEGSGPSGRITKSDVLGADEHPQVPAPLVEQPAPQNRGIRREKMSTLRRKIAERLVEAQHNAAMLTTFNEADMSKVISLRQLQKRKRKYLACLHC